MGCSDGCLVVVDVAAAADHVITGRQVVAVPDRVVRPRITILPAAGAVVPVAVRVALLMEQVAVPRAAAVTALLVPDRLEIRRGAGKRETHRHTILTAKRK